MLKGKQKQSITRNVKIGFTLVIVLLSFSIWNVVNFIVEKMEDSAVSTTQSLLDKLSDNIELSMSYDEKAILNFANELDLENDDVIRSQLEDFQTTYQFLDVYYVDVKHQGFNGLNNAYHNELFPIDDIALSQGRNGFSDAYNGSFGLWESVYQVPIKRNGQVVGALYVQIELNKYENGNAMNFYGESGMAYVFDAQTKNIVLMPATPNVMMTYMQNVDSVFEELGFSQSQMEQEVYPAIKQRDKLVLEGTLRDERVYMSLVSLPIHDSWYLCGIVSADEIQQEAIYILRMLTIVLAIMLVVMVMIIALVIYELVHRNKERLAHLREIEMQNAIYDTIGDASDSVLCIFNKESKKCEFTFHNIERILGITKEAFMEQDHDLHHLLDQAEVGLYERMLKGEILVEETYQISYLHPIHHDMKDLRITIKTLYVQGVASYMLIMEDITQDIKIQESLQTALANATQANQAKSEFLSHMSHEIRTPINAIIGMHEIAKHHLQEPERIKDCLNKISQSSRHLLELVNDILDLSKIESGKLSLHQQDFVLSDCLSDVYNIINTQAEAKKQKFILDTIGIRHDQLIGDEIRIKQILINLLNNAVKYTQKEGEISLTIKEIPLPHKEYSKFVFQIRDNGVGMSKDFINHIGKPFEQETNVFHKSEAGTGLGLSIVKNVISIMGGYLHVESELHHGTSIAVEISLKHDENIEYEGWKQMANMKVLVIDDDHQVLEDVKSCLEAFDIQCDIADNARKGFALLQDAKRMEAMYDVAIIDWRMPEESGVELTKRIRKEISRDLPVIFISAYDWSDIEKEARDAGVNDFIEKPLFTKRLYDALSKLEEPSEPITIQEMPELKDKLVLVVEDNDLNREIAVELLKMKGIKSETAVNGEEALAMFQATKPYTYDLILMDLQMPVMDGAQATREIRMLDREDARDIPIVAMTANAFAEDIAQCKEAGMNAHLGKPIEVENLYGCIASQIKERKKRNEKD